jgi:hypothetical protein
MIETMFYFFVLVAIGLLCLGLYLRPPISAPFLMLSSVVFMLIGLLLISQYEGITETVGATITDLDDTTIQIDYNRLMHLATLDNVAGRDPILFITSWLFTFGGIVFFFFGLYDLLRFMVNPTVAVEEEEE